MSKYQEIGRLLVRAREDRGYSVPEVAKSLNLPPRYIYALEEGRMEALPGISYAKGYLKRYASLMALDWTELLRRFELATNEPQQTSFFIPHHFSNEKQVPLGTALSFFGVAVVLGVLWLWLIAPSHTITSLVEKAPEKAAPEKPPEVDWKQTGGAACLRPTPALYPPCIWAEPASEPSMMRAVKP